MNNYELLLEIKPQKIKSKYPFCLLTEFNVKKIYKDIELMSIDGGMIWTDINFTKGGSFKTKEKKTIVLFI